MITPAFHFKILERFVEIFDRLGNTVIDKLRQLDDDSRANGFEFSHMAALYALDVMCGRWNWIQLNWWLSRWFWRIFNFLSFVLLRNKETAMGVSLDALSKPDSEYVKAVGV